MPDPAPTPSFKGQRFYEAGKRAAAADRITATPFEGRHIYGTQQHDPGAPVPPDDLKAEWLRIPAPGPVFCMDAPLNASAAWGYAQAIPERAELAALLAKARDTLQSIGYSTSPQIDQSLLTIAAECHAAAERLTAHAQETP
jgi:hypothetical protein